MRLSQNCGSTPARRWSQPPHQVEECIREADPSGLILVNDAHTAPVFINDDEAGLHHVMKPGSGAGAPEPLQAIITIAPGRRGCLRRQVRSRGGCGDGWEARFRTLGADLHGEFDGRRRGVWSDPGVAGLNRLTTCKVRLVCFGRRPRDARQSVGLDSSLDAPAGGCYCLKLERILERRGSSHGDEDHGRVHLVRCV
jgi:hypothetical protein